MDTLSLYENTRYVFPIKTMYNGDLSPLTILSNSLQNGLADEIEFKTTDKSKKYMKVKYTCKAINNITKETKNLHQEFVVRLLKRE